MIIFAICNLGVVKHNKNAKVIQDIINYGTRLLILILGIFLLLYPIEGSMKSDEGMIRIVGVMMIAWGIYRVFRYRSVKNKYRREEDED